MSIVLALYPAFVAFNSFYLVPDDPYLSETMNWLQRIAATATALVVLLALLALAGVCFSKSDKLGKH